MSGVYLTVWDEGKVFDDIIRPTPAGWPHLTIAWTGKTLSAEALRGLGCKVLEEWVMHSLTLSKAILNTFTHEKTGKQRFDILLVVDEHEEIENTRERLFIRAFPLACDQFRMRTPHITARVCWSKKEAERELAYISKRLPLTVVVTGVCLM